MRDKKGQINAVHGAVEVDVACTRPSPITEQNGEITSIDRARSINVAGVQRACGHRDVHGALHEETA